MREIKLNNVPYLYRSSIIKIEVDESTLDFRNGVAIAEATCTIIKDGKPETVQCCGLINEDFEEIYSDTNLTERNLMFFSYNRSAYRLSDNDYIIEVACGDGERRSWTEYRHIRVVDGVPTLVSEQLGKPNKTSVENLVVLDMYNGKVLYDISRGEKETPYLISIVETEIPGVFDVEARVALEPCENRFELIDHLFFRIDGAGRIISNVVSSLDNDYLSISEECTIDEMIEKRKNSLRDRTAQFNDEVQEYKKSSSAISKETSGYVIKPKPNRQ